MDTLIKDSTSDGHRRSSHVGTLVRTLVTGLLLFVAQVSLAQSNVASLDARINKNKAERYGVDVENIGKFGRDTSRPNAVAIFAYEDRNGAFENPGR
ncbi:MAG: hypothetical protein EON58_09140 [Alphaproteobacteria bacterium]|nr:MAG: hypothetical protein EON58_09140 [Alphaproteobacteria bacterium]